MRKASTSTQLAAKAKPQEEKTWDQIVPSQYHKWKKVFSEKEAWCLPQHRPWDIAINLVGGDNHALDCKVYPLTSTERPKLDKHICYEWTPISSSFTSLQVLIHHVILTFPCESL